MEAEGGWPGEGRGLPAQEAAWAASAGGAKGGWMVRAEQVRVRAVGVWGEAEACPGSPAKLCDGDLGPD